MRLQPKRTSNFQHINTEAAPPSCFVSVPVELAVVAAAQRNGELITHFAGESATLRKAKVVRIGRKPAAHEARVARDQPDVIAIAYPPRFRQRQHALVDGVATVKIVRMARLCICF
jgi:hypothetical protein